jgi:hypothetical protein
MIITFERKFHVKCKRILSVERIGLLLYNYSSTSETL